MNSLLLAVALKKNGVRFELHHYAYGIHGGSIAEPYVYPDDVDPMRLKEAAYYHNWVDLALSFIKEVL